MNNVLTNCPTCGAFITDADIFCGECGQPLSRDVPGAEPKDLDEILGKLEVDLPVASPATEKPSLAAPAPVSAKQGLARKSTYLDDEKPFPPVRGLVLLVGTALLLLTLGVAGVLSWHKASEQEPQFEPGDLIYEEVFDGSSGGWDVYTKDDSQAGYAEGEYRLGAYCDNCVVWGNPLDGALFTSFVAEVDARQVAGPLDNNLGLLIRYQADGENFYWFQVSGDGYYSVDMLLADEWITLVAWQPSKAIHQGLEASNHLQVVCDGDRFSFYVNDNHLVDVTDGTFRSGAIGLAAGTFDEPGVVVHFDNLKMYVLPE
jgi:hypothetical protein